jgi:hypothetical protein
MTGLVPLFLLWAASQKGGGSSPTATSFPWPTPSSPPPMPPMPAFQPGPAARDANTGTPLEALSQPTPEHKPPPVHKQAASPEHKAKPTPLQRAKAAAKAKVKNAVLNKARGSFSVPMPGQKSVSVLEVQTILSKHGAKLKRDGLYGPVTANTWAKIANAKGLAPTISRGGPKVAKVVPKTYEALKVPPIP